MVLATVTGALGRLKGAFWKPEQVADSASCSWEPSFIAACWLTSTPELENNASLSSYSSKSPLSLLLCWWFISFLN